MYVGGCTEQWVEMGVQEDEGGMHGAASSSFD